MLRDASAEWQERQLSSRWHDAQDRMFRFACSEWLLGVAAPMTAPASSRTHPGGWKRLSCVPVPNGLRGCRPGSPPSGSGATPLRW
jgi:hypothetical protein